jgi:hypothetical protein
VDVAGDPDPEVVLPTSSCLEPLEQLNVPDLRGLDSPGLAVNQPEVELISAAHTHAHEPVRTGHPSVAQPSRKQTGIKRDFAA